jgi:Domain of unknown function (DUF4129)
MSASRGPRGRGTLLLVGSVAVGLLVVAAAVAPDAVPFLDSDERDRVVVPAPPLLFELVLIVAFFGLIITYVTVKVRALKEFGTRRNRSFLPGVLLFATLLAVWAASPTVQDWVTGVIDSLTDNLDRIRGSDVDGDPPLEVQTSAALGYAVTFLLMFVVGGVIAALWLASREPKPPVISEEEQREIARGIESGIEDLTTIDDPRRAVIACYTRMQAAASLAGIPRRPSDTPFETLARMLERHNVSEVSARRLTELFERARFSTHQVDEGMRAEALDALFAIREQLGIAV